MTFDHWLPGAALLTAPRLGQASVLDAAAVRAGGDTVVGVAFCAIACALAFYMRRRPDMGHRWMAWLIASLLVARGLTLLLSLPALWAPIQSIQGALSIATALLAATTTVLLWQMIPRITARPSRAELARRNEELAAENAAAALAHQTAARARDELERRVAERTADLVDANDRLTEALRVAARAEEDYRVSFEGSTVGKVQSEPQSGRMIRVNRAFAAMLGYTPEELTGQPGKDMVWPGDVEEQQQDHTAVVTGRITQYVRERRYRHRDGSFVWGRVSASIIRNRGGGRPDLSIGVVENIHEERKAREALRVTLLDLERTVEERTAALAQRDLLLREVYHRVKNNLQVVDSLLVMQSRALTDPAARAGLRALRSRIFALGLVHHQLMGSGNLQTFDVAPFLTELSRNLVQSGPVAGIDLAVRADPLDVGLDFAIPLGLLVTELVTNALKYAFPVGVGKIEVRLSHAADGVLDLAVCDNGQGYEPAALLDETGLGARIVRGLVGQLRGTMTIHQEGGTQCHITLPSPFPLATAA